MENIELSKIEIDPARLIEARGSMSKTEVAKKIGVTIQAIDNIEAGRSKPSSSLLLKLCALYDIDARSLANEKILAA